MKLRPYQIDAKTGVYYIWNRGWKNALVVLPTGAGKTVLFSEIIKEHRGASCAIAHRQELVAQMSMALARDGVRHRIIGPDKLIRLIAHQHQTELGRCFYDSTAQCAVASVDTLKRRADQLSRWLPQVTLWVQDEAHHVLESNKWGTVAALFPNAKGLGVTATPLRADGKGLGREFDGLFDDMHVGPDMRELIDAGYLTDYRIFAPPSDLKLDDVKITGAGDYSPKQLKQQVQKSHIVGDVVAHYLRIAPGKMGVTFVESVETATRVAAEYNAAGVPAEVVSANTPTDERAKILRRFKNRNLLQLVNVDLFGEGFDLPAIEVVSMARPTQSYGLFTQQFGRALRLMLPPEMHEGWGERTDAGRLQGIAASTKPRAIIIDHVGNCLRHGLPDLGKNWTLARREKRGSSRPADDLPLKNCLNPECLGVYEAFRTKCPHCGSVPKPAARSGPEQVDGDLVELDPVAFAALLAEKNRVDAPPKVAWNSAKPAIMNIHKNHAARQEAQHDLRDAMAWWAGVHETLGYSSRESHKIFYFRFKTDVLSAQSLNRADADALRDQVRGEIERLTNEHNLTGVKIL